MDGSIGSVLIWGVMLGIIGGLGIVSGSRVAIGVVEGSCKGVLFLVRYAYYQWVTTAMEEALCCSMVSEICGEETLSPFVGASWSRLVKRFSLFDQICHLHC